MVAPHRLARSTAPPGPPARWIGAANRLRRAHPPNYVTPAWLSVRPGRAVELLPTALVTDLQPDKQKIIAWGLNDYVVQDPVLGPEWFIGNHLEPLLRKEHRQFTQFTGID